MRNRSPGESLPRRIIRLQRARRCRRRPPCPDIERRTLKCAPSPHRPAVRVPARFFAATSISWTSICRRCPSSRIHKRRDKSVLTSISHLTTPPDVSPAINLLQCGLLPDLSDHRNWTQAQLSGARGVNAIRTTFFGTTFEPIRAGNRKRLTCSSLATGLLPSPVPASASLATAAYFTSNTSPPSSQHSPQQETADGWCAALTHPASRTPEDDQLLVDLKEKKNLTWKQIADFFPGRSSGTLQVRYCTKLKAKTTVWTDEMVSDIHVFGTSRPSPAMRSSV
jgi:hypothetical protein